MLSARANRMAASKYSDTKEDIYTLKGGEHHLVTAGERATEAMDNAVSAYKQDTSDLESLNSQIKETQNSIVELQSKGGLTLVEKGQLEELRQTTRELQLQKGLLEKTTATDAREAAAKVTICPRAMRKLKSSASSMRVTHGALRRLREMSVPRWPTFST